jgi:excisionase family DNA binding protein
VDEQYLKIPEVAKRLGMSRGTIYNFINAGKLEAVKLGKSRRIALSALLRFIEEEKKASAAGNDPA